MTFKANDPTTSRDFYFSPAGKNDRDGQTVSRAVADPVHAVARVSAVSPPPGSSDPASINASVSGTYSEGVIIPEFVTCKASAASIITVDAINVQAMGRHEVEWGSLLNFASNGVVFEIDGRTRVAAEVNACVPVGVDGVGFEVSGACDDIFIQLRLGDILGEGGIMFNHTANSPTPIQYSVENITFSADNQTAVMYNDPVQTTATVFNISDIQTKDGATALNSTAIHIVAGTAVVDSDVLNAVTVAHVEGGATLTLDAQAMFGRTLIEDGGIAIFKSVSIMQGAIDIQGAGSLQVNVATCIGNVSLEAGSGLGIICGNFIGDLDNEGTVFAIIDNHVGEITGGGVINGIINGQLYGNWTPESVLVASSIDNQEPDGTDNPLQITYGAAQGTISDPVMLDADGSITINEGGYYEINATYSIGRGGSSGGSAVIFIRGLLDAGQVGNPVSAIIGGTSIVITSQLEIKGFIEAGFVLTTEIVRDSLGMNDGGIFSIESSIGWGDSPSASIRIVRL